MTHLLHSHVLPHRLSHLCCSRSGGLSICQLPYFGRSIFCLLQTSYHQPTKPTTLSPCLPYRPIQSSSSDSTWSHIHYFHAVHLVPKNAAKKLHCNVIIHYIIHIIHLYTLYTILLYTVPEHTLSFQLPVLPMDTVYLLSISSVGIR